MQNTPEKWKTKTLLNVKFALRREQRESIRAIDFGKAFVGVTQHTIPHTSEIYVDLLQHNMASTTPHQHSIYTSIERWIGKPLHSLPTHISWRRPVSYVVVQRQ